MSRSKLTVTVNSSLTQVLNVDWPACINRAYYMGGHSCKLCEHTLILYRISELTQSYLNNNLSTCLKKWLTKNILKHRIPKHRRVDNSILVLVPRDILGNLPDTRL